MDSSIRYFHNKPPSFLSQFLQSLMSLVGMKNDIETRMIKKKYTQEAATIPNSLKNNFNLNVTQIYGRQTWILKPKQNVSKSNIIPAWRSIYF